MDILVTLNAGYLRPLIVMLTSLLYQHPDQSFSIYVLHRSLTREQFDLLRRVCPTRCTVISVEAPKNFLGNAPTKRRYPIEMYYRIFAAKLLPERLERIVYLDPDLVILNPLDALWKLKFEGKLFAAATHTRGESAMGRINEHRLSMAEGSSYVNTGVILMNLARLRMEQDEDEVFDYLRTHRLTLMLPDQDVFNAVYGERILLIDTLRYNLSERVFGLYNMRPEQWGHPLDIRWVEEHTCIVHYCGKNKPWGKNYIGEFDRFYLRYERMAREAGLL
ncbi:MAG: glycosyltransferase family 8 protein [Oscillospiraceae bacterium]